MEYFVSPEGVDDGSGTLEHPFRTLARAAEELKPGDCCILRGGVYRERLHPVRSGEPGRPIEFRACEGETPVISGGAFLEGWQEEGEGLWSAPMPVDLEDGNQLFAGARVLCEARWPADSGDLFAPVRATAAGGSATTLLDPALEGDADCWKGAVIWCAGGAKWICWGGKVRGFDPESRTLTFDGKMARTHWYTPCEGSEYVLMGVRAALTEPGEWWLDRESGRLWAMPPEGVAPEGEIEAKVRRTAIDLCGRSHIHLCGLHFRGAGLRTDGESRNLRLERLRGEYLAHSYLRDVSDEAVLIDGEDHVVLGCDFGFSSGSVLRLRGRHHKLLGNHIHHGNYGGLWSGTLSLAGRRHVIAHNTVRHSGRDLLSLHGLTESLIEYNDLSHAGWLTHDLGISYGHNTDFGGTLIRRNRVHDCLAKGLAEGIYFDHCSHNVVVCENLIWKIPDMPIQVNNPGHFNLIAHNSCYRTNTNRKEITSFDHSHRQDLFGCHFLNNLTNGPFNLPENAVVAGNRVAPDPGYVDGEGSDFRLIEEDGGDVVPIRGLNEGDAVAGAVQMGQPVWAAGRQEGMEIDESVEWVRPDWAYTNRLVNAAFELGSLEGWNPSAPERVAVVPGNGWGNEVAGTGDAPTGTSRFELELAGDCCVEQKVSGLPAETRFQLSAWVKTDGSGAPVVLEVSGEGGADVRAESNEGEWTRLVLEFDTGSGTAGVVVRVSHKGGDEHLRARVDNVGLLEAD